MVENCHMIQKHSHQTWRRYLIVSLGFSQKRKITNENGENSFFCRGPARKHAYMMCWKKQSISKPSIFKRKQSILRPGLTLAHGTSHVTDPYPTSGVMCQNFHGNYEYSFVSVRFARNTELRWTPKLVCARNSWLRVACTIRITDSEPAQIWRRLEYSRVCSGIYMPNLGSDRTFVTLRSDLTSNTGSKHCVGPQILKAHEIIPTDLKFCGYSEYVIGIVWITVISELCPQTQTWYSDRTKLNQTNIRNQREILSRDTKTCVLIGHAGIDCLFFLAISQ